MKLENYIDYEYLFLTMCIVLAYTYFTSEKTKFIIRYD